ncbi:hypothetical protein HC028_12805 [Planosporangium flavigriseum]|uniref:Uncharacterized protein n=1 Tax=Planosporangium flavigriseum TaxID=373681 RepID=A0A8J3LK37_9ACTN|nr:hypothetical protein [Planosporangium flavigriseum]NJC65377.1 hypothetical protein [Planosporangium flavigriseum]GIG73267.1 hypothetical protein Pfl04_16710 [Planosporangium flavigriseum]
MQLRVRVADGSIDEARSLFTWLQDEPRVRTHGEPTMSDGDGSADPGHADHMGPGLDVLGLVIGSGLTTAQLVLSIIMWRASHGRPVRVIIERDGREVPVDTDDAAEAEAIAAKVETG